VQTKNYCFILSTNICLLVSVYYACSGASMNHDYETENTAEDPRMIVFFDSLLQHDMGRSVDDSDEEMPGIVAW